MPEEALLASTTRGPHYCPVSGRDVAALLRGHFYLLLWSARPPARLQRYCWEQLAVAVYRARAAGCARRTGPRGLRRCPLPSRNCRLCAPRARTPDLVSTGRCSASRPSRESSKTLPPHLITRIDTTEPSRNATPPAIDACRGWAALAASPWRLQTKATPTPPHDDDTGAATATCRPPAPPPPLKVRRRSRAAGRPSANASASTNWPAAVDAAKAARPVRLAPRAPPRDAALAGAVGALLAVSI